ncbi:MAG: InlB B-repeat-containing protein, partial [Paludibacteraceae bacterium]|nr:InlB B-repeat-containing protein [Paludibacteraceae bacterium]
MKNFNLIEMLRGCSKRSGTTFRQSNPDGQPTVNRQSRLMSHQGYLRNLAMIFAMLAMSMANIGMAWAVNSTMTRGETLFIISDGDGAWESSACVRAFFNKGTSPGDVTTNPQSTTWLWDGEWNGASGKKCFYTIVPTDDDYKSVRLGRYSSACESGDWWNYNGGWALQSNRSNDTYNTLYSSGSGTNNFGWKGAAYLLKLRGDIGSWSSDIATFEDRGNGIFKCAFVHTATATSYEFKLYDNQDNWLGSNVTLSGLTIGSTYIINGTVDLTKGIGSLVMSKAVHTPGDYEDVYGQTLKTVNGRDYEVYGFASTGSSVNYIWAGTSTTNKQAANCMLNFATTTEVARDWMANNINGRASTANPTATDEFPSGLSYYPMNYRTGHKLTISVQGYDQFSIRAIDANTSDKHFKVTINGTDVTTTEGNALSTSLSTRRYTLSPATTYLIQVEGLGKSNNTLYYFSLRVPAVTTYTVSYDANGGDADPSSTTQASSGASITLPAAPSYTGYTFNGWYTETSGGTRRGGAGDTYVPTSNETLHAQWTVKTTTLTLQSGSNGTGADQTSTATYGSGTLTSFTLHTANSGYALRGYYTAATGGVKVLDYDGSIVHATTAYTTSGGNWASELSSLTLTAQYDQEPTTVEITGTYHYFPGETISLSSSVTGAEGDATYSWDKNSSQLGTSSTYTKANCTTADAGGYLLTVCNGRACKTSAAFDVKILQFYLKNSGGGDISNGAFTHNDGTTTASITVNLNGSTTYKFRVTDGCNNWYGNSGKMTVSNCYDWPMNADADCQIETTVTGDYVFTVNYANLAAMTVSVLYPTNDQASGKKIWFDNSVVDFGTPYYRIGHNQNNTSTAMTKVYGTANLYEVTTAEYNGSSAWNITNNVGKLVNVYYTKTNDGDAITKATAFIGNCVTETPGVTITPGADHSTGGADNNNNCEFYSYTRVTGMKTDRVTISDYSNGTIMVNYTNTSNVASTLTSGYADLAHTVKLTSITAVANTGYDAGAITINGSAYSANYVVTGATTIAATFTPHVYTITYKDQGNVAFSGTHTDTPSAHPTSHTYNTATDLNGATKAGYTFDGWYTTSACTGDPVTSLGATAYTADITLYAKWTANSYSVAVTLTDSKATQESGDTGDNAATHGSNYVATFEAVSGYELPSDVIVYIGESQATKDDEYTWSISDGTGTLTINGDEILDDITITVTATSTCSTPADPDGLAAGSISSSGVTFTITDDESPASYEIYYSTSSTDPTGSTEASATTTSKSKAVTGLTANTTYYAWVRAVCDEDYKSDWVALGTSTFKTLATGTKYYLFTPTKNAEPAHTGSLSGQFRCATTTPANNSQTIDGHSMSHWCKFSTQTSLSGGSYYHGKTFIAYDIKTNSTDFTLYYYNNASAAKDIYYALIQEGITSAPTPVKVGTAKANSTGKATFTITASKNTRILFYTTDQSNMRCHQIVAEESGSALPKPGESGYKVGFKGTYSRFTDNSEGTNKQGTLDDSVKVVCYANYLMGTADALKIHTSGTDYISFRTGASACQVKVCVSSSNKTYYLGTSKSATTNEQTSTHTFALAANTRYYINPGGSDVLVDSIVFLPAPSGYTVSIAANPAGYGTVSAASVTSVASGTSLSASTNTLSVGATDVTATATSASAEYTYAFDEWTLSDGTALPSTVTADLSVYANFTRTANNYTLAWSSNGGSDLSGSYTSGSTAYGASITAPNDPTLSNYTFDGWNTANDGSGTTAGATMPAANTTYYAAWKQTVTLTTGAQGSGSNQTPVVYLNGTSVSDFTAHTASGYSLQGYYTAGSGGTKVLNADGTFASANVDGYITSSKWSRTGAAPTLYAQWVASEDCRTLKYVWKVTGNFCDDQSTATSTVSMISDNDYFTLSGTGYKQESGKSLNLQNTQNNYFLLTAKTGYQIKSICFYGKVQDSSVDYTTDGSSWSALA